MPPGARLCSGTRHRQLEIESGTGSLLIYMHEATMQDNQMITLLSPSASLKVSVFDLIHIFLCSLILKLN